MAIPWLLDRLRQWENEPALIWNDRGFSYASLFRAVTSWKEQFRDHGVQAGQVVAVEGDFSPNTIAVFLALIDLTGIVVPLSKSANGERKKLMEIAEVEFSFRFGPDDNWEIQRNDRTVTHPLTRQLIQMAKPGLILFSSGSTGENKAALHDISRLLEKFKVLRPKRRTLGFLLFDHIGGINTLFATLSSGGTLVTVRNRAPETVCRAIECHQVELLPTTPTFLNLLLISEVYRNFDLSSLKRITYGTEPMPEATLRRIRQILPDAELQQTYGLTEVGILRSKSQLPDSLWVQLGGEAFQTKVVDGLLWIRAESAMLGYLNAPSPFDEDGWMNTGDMVEVDGDFIRILGRRSEIINVGGQKVPPVEVESVLLQMDNIREVTVFGESNALLGQIVAARVTLTRPEPLLALKKRIQIFCKDKLAAYKIPMRIAIVSPEAISPRYKKIRQPQKAV
ncbi:MAG: AMP-binding protein [Acidobacteria bacterium]|nr:AMP-binding protein [Acidobacteriota bacterium]